MFSQACFKNSVHRRGGVSRHALGQIPPCPVHAGIHPRQDTPRADTPRQTPPRQTPRADTPLPPTTATVVDGTHPTGMNSCSKLYVHLARKINSVGLELHQNFDRQKELSIESQYWKQFQLHLFELRSSYHVVCDYSSDLLTCVLFWSVSVV